MYQIKDDVIIMPDGSQVNVEEAIRSYLEMKEIETTHQELVDFLEKVNDSEEAVYKVLRKFMALVGLPYHSLRKAKRFSDNIRRRLALTKQHGPAIMNEFRAVMSKYNLDFSSDIIKALEEVLAAETETSNVVEVEADSAKAAEATSTESHQ